jgi:transcriptional regulator with XRE-family HTH domain
MEMTVSIIKQLIELRHSRNLTLKGVAAGTGLSVSFLSDIEHGRGNPTLETLEQIAEFYGHALRIVGPTLTAAPTPPPADTGAGDGETDFAKIKRNLDDTTIKDAIQQAHYTIEFMQTQAAEENYAAAFEHLAVVLVNHNIALSTMYKGETNNG